MCTVAIKNIKNVHAVSTSQIADILHFNDNAINCLNINRVTIYRAKCFGIVTLKVLPTSCFRYNSEEKSAKIADSGNEAKQE